ncbi:MAG: hypothetical protein HYZ28_24735 [Myxococcales bacterium]|nr:hypothetical protein [Myxococcales bacterium]
MANRYRGGLPCAPVLLLLSFAVGLLQGLLHAVGPDHCAAVVTLGGTGARRRVLKVALRFAAGHALALGGLAGLCLAAGVGLSEAFERWTEVLGGVLLIALGAAALLFPGALRHGHPHLGNHGPAHVHQRLPIAAGALLALSGLRSLMLALPPLMVGGSLSLSGWAYLPGFALGVLGGMGAVGLLWAEASARLGEKAAGSVERAAALFTAALGGAWIVLRL